MIDFTNSEMMDLFASIFSPHGFDRIRLLRETNGRFCHYTSAEAALAILRSHQVWLRNALVMNDFSEVQHGRTCLAAAYNDDAVGGRLKLFLEKRETGLTKKLEDAFNARSHAQSNETFMLSISEHDPSEDLVGRLSMWRAYGGNTNVALVMNNTPFLSPTQAITAYTSPVLYAGIDAFKGEFERMVAAIEANSALIGQISADMIVAILVETFQIAALSTKHPGFAEEREWRVLYSPSLRPTDRIASSVQIVGGVPQKVYALPMTDYPNEGFIGATIPALLDRIIIGPTEQPYVIWDALVDELGRMGIPKPEQKVVISDIPLRR